MLSAVLPQREAAAPAASSHPARFPGKGSKTCAQLLELLCGGANRGKLRRKTSLLNLIRDLYIYIYINTIIRTLVVVGRPA